MLHYADIEAIPDHDALNRFATSTSPTVDLYWLEWMMTGSMVESRLAAKDD